MANDSALLANIFQMVTKTLADNQQALNQADEQNHDHGTNMVQTFQTISRSIENKKNGPGSDALAYAAQQLSKESTSGSGKLYAQGLANAATQFKGQAIDAQAAVQLLQTLIGGGQPAQQQQAAQPAGGDLLGALLGGLTGGGQQQQQQPEQPAGADLLGALLGGLNGGGHTQQQQQATQPDGGDILGALLGGLTGGGNSHAAPNTQNSGLDMGDLLNAGLAFMQAKQSGGSNATALMQAVVAGSGMGNSSHRAQSTQLVASSFLQALGALTSKSG